MAYLTQAEIDAAGGDALARAPLEAPFKLKRTRAALGRAATGSTTPGLILHIGDSTERTPYLSGTGIPLGGAQLATSYRLAKKLGALGYKTTTNAVFGANGFSAANMTSYDPRVTFGAGWAPGSQQSLGGSMFANASDTSTLAFAFSDAFNRIIVYYRTNPLNGVFTVDIGGAVLQTVTTGTADTFASAQIDTGVAAASGSVNIKRVSGTLEIIGIVAYDSTNPGLIFINGARGGWNSSNWVAVGQGWHPSNVVRTLAPALIIDGNGGVNDVDNNADPTTPFIGLSTFIANKRAALNLWSPVSDILLETLPPQDATWAVIANQDQYAQAVRDLAKEYGFALYDQYSRLVSRSDANLYGNYGDPRHPSPIAHDDRATALVRLLTQ